MIARRIAIGVLAGGVTILFVGYDVTGFVVGGLVALLVGFKIPLSNSYRFRMTVEVETPEGVKVGSSVYEVRARRTKAMLPDANTRKSAARGEAVAVDLHGGRTLFALTKTGAIHGGLVGLSMSTLDPAFKNDIVESAARISAGDSIRSPAEVEASDYPLLVTFADMADPTSLEGVDPSDLSKMFGHGVRLKRIVVEVTNDQVTTGIEARLAWLDQLEKYRTVKSNPFTNVLPREIGGLRSK
jgi:hypothetical protein